MRFMGVLILSLMLATGTLAFADGKAKGQTDLDALKMVEGDENTNELRALKAELMIARTEGKAVEQITKLIKKYKGTMMEADLQFRLAELYMRRAKTARFFEINRQSATVVRLAPKVVANANSRGHIQKAIEAYEAIQKGFPRYKQLDLVVFNNAFARQQLGQEREAERLYWSLVQNFRGSALVPDSHLAIGEINFERNNFSFALEHFNAIKNYPESRVYPYGLYKAAWSHYNMRQADMGLKKLEEVVAYGRYVKEKKIEQRLDLRKEALADMTLFYEDVLPAKNAFAYFKKQAGELDVEPILLKLAKLYEHHSRFAEREVVLNDVIRNIPDSALIANIHSELIWNYDAMKKKDLAVQQMEKLFLLCKESSGWMKKQQKQAAAAKLADPRLSCIESLTDATMKLSARWLKVWKKNPSGFVDYADAAEKAFEIYLREPHGETQDREVRFAYAELLFQRQKYRKASEEYAKVGSTKKDNMAHDAAYGAVVSLEKAAGDKWSDADEKTFKALVNNYVTANPKGSYRLDLEFKLALIAYEKSRYDEASQMFVRLGKEHGQTEKGKKAQDLYLDILNLKKDYKTLKDYSLALIKVETDSARKDKLLKIHRQSYFLQVQSLEEAGKIEDAIAGYKDFVNSNSDADLAEKAWWNATNLHYKIMDFLGGAKAAQEYYRRFPKAKNGMDALLKAAQSYESLGMLEAAADVLGQIAQIDSKSATKWNALAADFYLIAGNRAKAKKLLADLRRSEDATVRTQSLDKLLLIEKQNGGSGYREILSAVANSGVQPQASLAKVELIEETFKAGQFTEAFNESKKIIGASQASSFAKSRARLIQARVLEDEFLKASVKARIDRVATVLAIKTEKLEKAQQAFQQAIKYGDPDVTVTALSRLANCYTHYVEALKKMPVPAGIAAEEADTFKNEISNLAIPLEEKAIETLNDGMRAAFKFRIQSPAVADMAKQLKSLNMPVPSQNEMDFHQPGIVLPSIAGVGQ